MRALSDAQVKQFIRDGFVRIDRAFPREIADEARAILWRDTGCDPRDPTTWTKPVIRLGGYSQEPFMKAQSTRCSIRHSTNLSAKGVGDVAQTLEASRYACLTWTILAIPAGISMSAFRGDDCDPNEPNDFSSWRANVTSRGRALLMLFLFSDVGSRDAPTRIRVGSHLDMARYLAPAGEAGMSHLMLDRLGADLPEALATGDAGTVYLCHPFVVHAAQRHEGTTPRFLAQPPLHPAEPLRLDRPDSNYSPVEIAIRQALREGRSIAL
jgi:hypothetical protein